MPSYNSRYIMLHAFVLVKHCGHHSWVVSCIYTGPCDTHDAYIELFVLLHFMFISRQNSPDNNRFICVNCRLPVTSLSRNINWHLHIDTDLFYDKFNQESDVTGRRQFTQMNRLLSGEFCREMNMKWSNTNNSMYASCVSHGPV
jgi:hypothetical protein